MPTTVEHFVPKPRRKWKRRLIILAILLLVFVGTFLATRGYIVRRVALGQLASMTGGTVEAGGVTLDASGTLTILDASVRVPGVPGEGGLIFKADRIEADVSWGSLLSGNPRISRVLLEQPLVRLSQSTDDASINVAALNPASGSGGPPSIPLVLVRGGIVELGEHAKSPEGTYRVLRRIPVAGQVTHAADQDGDMRIAFGEVDDKGDPVVGPGGVQLTGVVGKDAITLNLGVVSLAAWSPETMPGPIRDALRQLDLQGEIRDATLTYRFDGNVSAKAQVRGVSMTLPVEVKPSENAEGDDVPIDPRDVGRRLRMRDVTGTVGLTSHGLEADLAGQVEGLSYKVSLRSQGSKPDSAFICIITCNDLHLARKPEVLKFAPGIVRRRLEQFSDPIGRLDARVTIERPTDGADLSVSGLLTLRGMSAAFERFPYPFRNLAGEVEFDDHRIVIKKIEGDAPGGVRVVATGLISPITEEAEVKVDVTATNIPIDQTLRTAMATRGRIVDDMFSTRRHAQLVEAGLISSGGKGAGPKFDLGGVFDVHALVTRDKGPGSDNWHDLVTITLKEARVIPEKVPYPIIARGVTIIKKDLDATVSGGLYTGPEGGTAEVTAKADLATLDDPEAPFMPEIHIKAAGLPLSRLLTNAMPETAMLVDRPLREVLAEVDFAGEIELGATITPKGDDVAFRVGVTGTGVSATTRAHGGRAHIRDAEVTLDVSDEFASLIMRARVGAKGAQATPATLEVSADRRAERGTLTVVSTLPAFDTAAPIEDFVRLVAPAAADEIETLRTKFAPAGALTLDTTIAREPGGPLHTRVNASDLRQFSFTVNEGRVTIPLSVGEVVMARREGEPGVLTFSRFEAPALFAGEDTGVLSMSGEILTDGGPASTPLSVALIGGRFESPLVRAVMGTTAPARFAAFFRDSDVRGVFDFAADMTPRDGPGGREWSAAGSIRPRSLAVRFPDADVDFPTVTGSIDFAPGEGRLRDMKFGAPAWHIAAEGAWVTSPQGMVALTTQASVAATSLTPDLLAVLPDGVRRAFADLSGKVTGPIQAGPLNISLAYGSTGELDAIKVDGRAIVYDAFLDAGVTIEHARGVLDFSATREKSDPGVSFEVLGILDHMTASGLHVTGARVRLVGLADGSVLMPHFSGACHGGRLTGDAIVRAPGTGATREFEATIRVSGARFASVLTDFGTTSEDHSADPDSSRGLLDASITLGGIVGDPATRRGRGSGAVSGGRVLNFPLLVPLVRITNLQLPINENVDYAAGEFFISGEYLNFESLSVFSPSVEVVGFGTVRWPGMDLDMRFRPRARSRIPMITEVLEGIRNELVAVRAQGTLKKPELAISTLSGTSRVIGRLFGQTPDEQQRRLDVIEGRARQGSVKRDPAVPIAPGK